MAGSINSPSTDIFSYMSPGRVLNGLLNDGDYMVQHERELQYRDRCLHACVVMKDQVANCEGLLAKRIEDYVNLVCVLEKDTELALEEEKNILDLLKREGRRLDKANKALEAATKAEQVEVMKNPWGF
jgi:hypothetical protein